MSVEPAMTTAQSVALVACTKLRSQIGSVSDSGRVMITSAKTNSFHAWMKAKMLVETSPGARSGNVMRQNAWARLHPSIMAASSRSTGTPPTKPRSVQIVNGRTIAMYTAERPMTVLRRFQPSSTRNVDTIIASAGIIWMTRIEMMNAFRERKR